MITNLNLSLSSACLANCIMCPVNRGRRIKEKHMSFKTVKKIIDEVVSSKFKEQHCIKKIQLGENGDCFLNPDILKISMYIREKLPSAFIEVFTNFTNFPSSLSKVFISKFLIDSVWCNIDGKDEVNYYHVKGLDLAGTIKNLVDFANYRSFCGSNITLSIRVATLNRYIHKIHDNFGFYPSKLKDKSLINIPDDYEQIVEKITPLLRPGSDGVARNRIFGWAERELILKAKIPTKGLKCPLFDRVETSIFMAPDGTWYACCLDSDNELVFGNIHERSLEDIYSGQRRKDFLSKIKNGKFDEVGGPCRSVPGCITLR